MKPTVKDQEKFLKSFVPQAIKEARKLKGLTQTQLADYLGLIQGTYSRRESSKRFAVSDLILISRALGVTGAQMLEFIESEMDIQLGVKKLKKK